MNLLQTKKKKNEEKKCVCALFFGVGYLLFIFPFSSLQVFFSLNFASSLFSFGYGVFSFEKFGNIVHSILFLLNGKVAKCLFLWCLCMVCSFVCVACSFTKSWSPFEKKVHKSIPNHTIPRHAIPYVWFSLTSPVNVSCYFISIPNGFFPSACFSFFAHSFNRLFSRIWLTLYISLTLSNVEQLKIQPAIRRRAESIHKCHFYSLYLFLNRMWENKRMRMNNRINERRKNDTQIQTHWNFIHIRF